MVRKRLITVLTFNNGVLFRTKNFIPDYRYTLNFVDAWSVDEIVVLDVTPPGQGNRDHFATVVKSFAARCFVPLAAGGGVRSLADVRSMLAVGADKVVIGTAALETPDLITRAAKLFGSQCVVVSINTRRTGPGQYEVYSNAGAMPTGLRPEAWARQAQELGAGEILVHSIDEDGSLEGYDNELNRRVAEAVDIPVLACGGAGKWEDFARAFKDGKVSGACTTCIYHFTDTSIRSAKSYLHDAGIAVRL
jgi:imidazole glycerol-phosphate synthase subunit HisF